MKEKKKSKQVAWMRPASVGPHFIVCMAIGYYFGSRLDRWLETDITFTAIFIFLGIIAGFRNLFKELQVINEEEEARLSQQKQEQDQIE